MAIYEQPVRVLLRKFLEATNMPLGKLFTRADIIDWFRENYPKIVMNTVTGWTTAATTNANSRVYWKPTAADDLFFQVELLICAAMTQVSILRRFILQLQRTSALLKTMILTATVRTMVLRHRQSSSTKAIFEIT